MDVLARDDAPLTQEQWAQLDELVLSTAKKYLTARRLLPMMGPLGYGMPVVPAAQLEVHADEPSRIGARKLTLLQELTSDFELDVRDFVQAERMGVPVNFAPALAAALQIAQQEDDLLYNGLGDEGQPGLLTVDGRHIVDRDDWETEGTLVRDFARAVDLLGNAGFPGPYAVVMSPGTRAMAHRTLKGPRLEIEILQDLAEAGVYASNALAEQMLVMEVGRGNADLAVGLDLTTGYYDQDGMTHIFRIMETLALRVKRPNSIVVMG
ncbi:MAG: bacteriocin family protein [candidate division WS1 bacterium]|jgi:uncharacterized linocin/CFP29 family protein|nr:bacteriocin family protein [candidate division WS1 bacterium]